MKAAGEPDEQHREKNGGEQDGIWKRLKILLSLNKEIWDAIVFLAPWSAVSANNICARVGKAGLKTTDSLKKCLGREIIPRKTEVLLWLANEMRSYVASSSYKHCFSFEVS